MPEVVPLHGIACVACFWHHPEFRVAFCRAYLCSLHWARAFMLFGCFLLVGGLCLGRASSSCWRVAPRFVPRVLGVMCWEPLYSPLSRC